MNNIIYIFLFLISVINVYGQNCFHSNLSKKFDFKIDLLRFNESACDVSIHISEKKDKRNIQIIKFKSEFIFEKDYTDCTTVRSYSTNIKNNTTDIDNDFGDLIVADFNFDGKEDFAIKRESGGNGGPIYFFYLQVNNSKFILDKFLSNNLEFFPFEINHKKKTLTTLVHANAYQKCKSIFKFNPTSKNWKLVSKVLIEY